jgi:NAD(P)-dependent dehydrogenase (short-subunit alcohol dehydrogenase family)
MKYALITGISSGIGLAAADALWNKGWHVIGTVRKNEDAEKLKSKYPERLSIYIMDVRDLDKYDGLRAGMKSILGNHPLACLVNNAGVAVPGPLELLTEDEFESQLDINVKSVRRMTNLCLDFLRHDTSPGTIINISSVSGILTTPYNVAYSISKHALECMTDGYRRELRPFGIQVVSILPGPIKTDIWQKNLGKMEKYMDTIYAGRLASADKMIENAERRALPVESISELIIKIVESKRPKTRYHVVKKVWLIRLMTSIMPDRMLDNLFEKAYKRKEKFRPI